MQAAANAAISASDTSVAAAAAAAASHTAAAASGVAAFKGPFQCVLQQCCANMPQVCLPEHQHATAHELTAACAAALQGDKGTASAEVH